MCEMAEPRWWAVRDKSYRGQRAHRECSRSATERKRILLRSLGKNVKRKKNERMFPPRIVSRAETVPLITRRSSGGELIQ